MSIVLEGSTSGSVTLQEPAVAGTTVLDLPAVSGTILTTTSPKAGNVIQVVQGTKTDTFSTSVDGVFTDVTGLSVSITPSSSSSKILVLCSVAFGYDNIGGARWGLMSLFRGATNLISPTSPSDRTGIFASPTELATNGAYASYNFQYLDSPASTSSLSYNIKVFGTSASGTIYINRSENDTDSLYYGRSVSTIIAMEIAA
jgi:hypothetical protein